MAEVIVNEVGNVDVGGVMQMVIVPLRFILNNWFIFVIGLLLLIAVVVVIVLMFKIKEERLERDEPGYYNFKKAVRDCEDNADRKKIKKKYSMLNLLWLGIPIVWKDRSVRIYNIHEKKIGTYRGESISQDGFHNLLICKSMSFGFMDNNILVKVPIQLKVVQKEVNKKTKKEQVSTNILKFKLLKLRQYDNTFILNCIGIERIGLYYYLPVLKQEDNVIPDFRKYVEENLNEGIYQTMLSRQLNTNMKQMEEAVLINPNLQYNQKSPMKTSPESDLDDD